MIIQGNALSIPLADKSVHMCVTSPPYWGLRDYGTAKWIGGDPECDHIEPTGTILGKRSETFHGSNTQAAHEIQYKSICGKCGAIREDHQLGLEQTPEQYVANMVAVFREVKRVLRDDGTLWLNLGDSYASQGGPEPVQTRNPNRCGGSDTLNAGRSRNAGTLKPKDLVGIPWRVAFALQADGWYLRSDIIWSKPNPMPESVTDRCTKSHEYLFMLAKSERYFYDNEAVREPGKDPEDDARRMRDSFKKGNGHKETSLSNFYTQQDEPRLPNPAGRNRRTVWTISTKPFNGAKLLADYVGDDGKPYRASPDCPIHGHLRPSQKFYMPGYGEQQDQPPSRTIDNGNDPASMHATLRNAKTYHTQPEGGDGNSLLQIPENTNDCKSEVLPHEYILPVQTPDRTNRTIEPHDDQDHTRDLQHPSYSLVATDHNNESCKIDPAPLTSEHDTVFAQIPDHTQNKPPSGERDDSAERIHENSISESDLSDNHTTQKAFRNGHKHHDTVLNESFSTSKKELYCTCTVVSIDHFATYPPALVEPCIMAGTSERGVCPVCGMPWARVTTETRIDKPKKSGSVKPYADTLGLSQSSGIRTNTMPIIDTTGWRPTCDHDAEPVPAICLDPFNGSGTTGQVARKLGRAYVGLDLSWEYLQLAKERIGMLITEDLPLFEPSQLQLWEAQP